MNLQTGFLIIIILTAGYASSFAAHSLSPADTAWTDATQSTSAKTLPDSNQTVTTKTTVDTLQKIQPADSTHIKKPAPSATPHKSTHAATPHPRPSETEIVRSYSAATLGLGGFSFILAGSYATAHDYLSSVYGPGTVRSPSGNRIATDMPHFAGGLIGVGVGITHFLDIHAGLPLYYDRGGFTDHQYGIGDAEIMLKMRQPGIDESMPFAGAWQMKALLPTGREDRGFFPRHAHYFPEHGVQHNKAYTSGDVVLNPAMIWTFDAARIPRGINLQIHLNAGGLLSRHLEHALYTGAFSIVYAPLPLVTFFAEASGEVRSASLREQLSVQSVRRNPLWFTPGCVFHLPHDFSILIAGDIALSSTSGDGRTVWQRDGFSYATAVLPRYGARLSIGWHVPGKPRDRDGDGIADFRDACPHDAEDLDGFDDHDGCPDIDNDNDGVIDSRDKCVMEPAVTDGCPVRDADGDGIVDSADKCPNQPEDFDCHDDRDGCPDLDNDNDGIPDSLDACPNAAEDPDGFADQDGCPDLDNDADGIDDRFDDCPNHRGLPENKGCPKTQKIERGRLILKGVHFETGKAVLTRDSYTILGEVAQSLLEWPEIRIEVQGHTDGIGPADANRRLSQARAESVVSFIVGKGIAAERIRAVGMGEDVPMADNKTADGRARNRRVEIHRIDSAQ